VTTVRPTSEPSPRPGSLQADLLADLQQATPTPITRPGPDASAPVPAERRDATDPQTPAVEVRVTPRHWSAPSVRPQGTGTGLVLTVGPVRISITGFR
jgi:hypothetical protein